MAENDPAADAGTPTPHHRHHDRHGRHRGRKPLCCTEVPAAPPACPAKAKSKIDIAIEEAAARLAADAPPLSEGQKRRLAELFAPAVSAVKR